MKQIRRWGLVGVVVGAVGMTAACNLDLRNEDQKAREEAQARQLAAVDAAREAERRAAEAKEREKQNLRQQPDRYLSTSGVLYHDKGIINDYRQVIGMTVLNRSAYPVTSLQGEVEWQTNAGQVVGKMPFTLTGSVPAGGTVQFSESAGTLQNGTIQTSATRALVRFTSLQIVEAR
jgi:hypothetical protein